MSKIFGRECIPTFPDQRGDVYTIETWEYLNIAVQATVQGGIAYDLELPALCGDGTLIWINTRCNVERDANGEICALRGTVQDITSRRQAAEQVYFQARLPNAIGQAVIATDIEGRVTYINAAAEQLYGWSSAGAVGRNIVDITVPEMSLSHANEIMGQLTQGHPWSGEFAVQHSGGRVITAEVHNTPILDPSGKMIGIIGVSSDISVRKQTEQSLAQSKERYHKPSSSSSSSIRWTRH